MRILVFDSGLGGLTVVRALREPTDGDDICVLAVRLTEYGSGP